MTVHCGQVAVSEAVSSTLVKKRKKKKIHEQIEILKIEDGSSILKKTNKQKTTTTKQRRRKNEIHEQIDILQGC